MKITTKKELDKFVDSDVFSSMIYLFLGSFHHCADFYHLIDEDSEYRYNSRIYYDYLEKEQKCQGKLSQLIQRSFQKSHFSFLYSCAETENHYFAIAFAYVWNMTDKQIQALTQLCRSENFIHVWEGLNYFLCEPSEEQFPHELDLELYHYTGAYYKWSILDPTYGEWIEINDPKTIFQM